MMQKYLLSIFKNNNLAYSWSTVKIGWDLKRLTMIEISNYALEFMEQNPGLVNKHISELIFGIKEYELAEFLKNVFLSLDLQFPEKNSSLWNIEWRKWRYAILSEMCKNIADDGELIIKIDGLYVDFGYPEDMESLSYHGPIDPKDSQKPQKVLRKILINKTLKFLNEEKEKIDARIDHLPFRGIMYEHED